MDRAPAPSAGSGDAVPSRTDSPSARIEVSNMEIDTLDEEALDRLPAGQREAVRHLHTQVARAVAAIRSLKAENRRLRERIAELEKRPAVPEDETVVTFPTDPQTLRETVDHFIDAIDDYLDAEAAAGDGAPPSSLSPGSPEAD